MGNDIKEIDMDNEKEIVKETFDKVQALLDTLQDKDATCLFVTDDGRFVISGEKESLEVELIIAMVRYPIVKDIVFECASKFRWVKKDYGEKINSIHMNHLIEKNSGN